MWVLFCFIKILVQNYDYEEQKQIKNIQKEFKVKTPIKNNNWINTILKTILLGFFATLVNYIT